MPWWTTVLIAFGGLLLGGSWSLYKQKAPLWLAIGVAACGVMSVIAGFMIYEE